MVDHQERGADVVADSCGALSHRNKIRRQSEPSGVALDESLSVEQLMQQKLNSLAIFCEELAQKGEFNEFAFLENVKKMEESLHGNEKPSFQECVERELRCLRVLQEITEKNKSGVSDIIEHQ